jgi:hypothetical protein
MFGPGGTYTSGGLKIENATSVELIHPDGKEGFQIDAGVSLQGRTSTMLTVPKHSFRLDFSSEFGPTELVYPLFNDSTVVRFDQVLLKGITQDGWQRSQSAAENQNQLIKDEYARRTQLAMQQPSPHGRWMHLYINGLYWGLFNVVERPNASFASEHLGGDANDWDTFNEGRLRDGQYAGIEGSCCDHSGRLWQFTSLAGERFR